MNAEFTATEAFAPSVEPNPAGSRTEARQDAEDAKKTKRQA